MKRARASEPAPLCREASEYWRTPEERDEYWQEMQARLQTPAMRSQWSRLYDRNPLGMRVIDKPHAPTRVAVDLKRDEAHRRRVIVVRCGAFHQVYGYDALLYCDVTGCSLMKNNTDLIAGQPKSELRAALKQFVARGIEVAIVEQMPTDNPKVFTRHLEQVVTATHPEYLSPLDDDLLASDKATTAIADPPLLLVRANDHNFAVASVYWLQRRAELVHCSGKEMLYEMVQVDQFAMPVHVFGVAGTEATDGVLQYLRQTFGGEHVRFTQRTAAEDSDRSAIERVLRNFGRSMGIDDAESIQCEIVERQPADACAPLSMATAAQFGLVAGVDAGVDALVDHCVTRTNTRHIKRTLRNWLRHPPPRDVTQCIRQACATLRASRDAVPQVHAPPRTLATYIVLLQRRITHADDLRHLCTMARDVLELFGATQHRALVEQLVPIVAHENGDAQLTLDECRAALVRLERTLMVASAADDDRFSPSRALPAEFVEKCERFRGIVTPSASPALAQALDVLKDCVQRIDHNVALDFGDEAVLELVTTRNRKEMCLRATGSRKTDVAGLRAGPKPGYVTTEWILELVEHYESAAERARACVAEALRSLAASVQLRDVRLAWHCMSVFRTLDSHVVQACDREWTAAHSDEQNLSLEGAWPYWMAKCDAAPNSLPVNGVAIITGANEGGKTTLLRTVGACALLATCGLYVPAVSARVPRNLQRIFIRTVSGDKARQRLSNLACEAQEIAPLSHCDVTNSLVLLDEMAQGTSFEQTIGITAGVIRWAQQFEGVHVLFSTHVGRHLQHTSTVRNVSWLSLKTVRRGQLVRYTHTVQDGVCHDSMGYTSYESAGCSQALLDCIASALREQARESYAPKVEPEFLQATRDSIRNSVNDVLRVFYAAITNVHEYEQCTVRERQLAPALFTRLHVVYLRLDRHTMIWYVGETKNIRQRIEEHRVLHPDHVFYIVAVPVTHAVRAEDLPHAIEQRVIAKLGHGVIALDSAKDGANRIVRK